MSKGTIVSWYPKEVIRKIPGIHPNEFTFPAGDPRKSDGFSVTVIPNVKTQIYLSFDRPQLSIPNEGYLVAQSLVNDFIQASAYVMIPDRVPGLVAFDGELTKEKLLSEHRAPIDRARASQMLWASDLIKKADDEWAKTKRHQAIGDLERTFAKIMGVQREWLVEVDESKLAEMVECKFCTSKIKASAIVCPECKNVLNPDAFEKMTAVKKIA